MYYKIHYNLVKLSSYWNTRQSTLRIKHSAYEKRSRSSFFCRKYVLILVIPTH